MGDESEAREGETAWDGKGGDDVVAVEVRGRDNWRKWGHATAGDGHRFSGQRPGRMLYRPRFVGINRF
jgi:hypothetical protein